MSIICWLIWYQALDWREYIHSNSKILLGKPVVKGTRLSVEFILGLFAAGWTEQQVLENYPTLTAEAIRAVFSFSAEGKPIPEPKYRPAIYQAAS
ncbi:DUF433 domain-containing protein [Phormidesmis sp. 146-35]